MSGGGRRQRSGGGGGGQRLELHLERLGEAGDGWAVEAEGATMGRVVRFATGDEMRSFVADLRSALAELLATRPGGQDEGPVTLMVFLAGHRTERRE